MAIKIHYSEEDDVFTIYDNEHKPYETIEFSEFLNLDIDKNKSLVGIEVFHASEFFSALNETVTKSFLGSLDNVFLECKNYRNNWFIVLVLRNKNNEIRIQMPPLRKSEYTSPLIASCH